MAATSGNADSYRLTLITFIALTLVCLIIGGLGGVFLYKKVKESNLRIQLANNDEYGKRFVAALETFIEMGTDEEMVLKYIQQSFITSPRDKNRYICIISGSGEVICHPNESALGFSGFNNLEMMSLENRYSSFEEWKESGIMQGFRIQNGEPVELIRRFPLKNAEWEVIVHTNLDALNEENQAVLQMICLILIPVGIGFVTIGTVVVRLLGRRYEADIEETNRMLEQRVQERTAELQESMEQLSVARDALLMSEKMALLGQLVAGIAHEVKNPLGAISMHAQLLEEEVEDEHALDSVRSIQRSADRCDMLVKNLLAFARNDPPSLEKISINQIIETSLGFCLTELRKGEIELSKQLDEHDPTTLADRIQVEQVVMNLVLNAAAALQKQDKPRKIEINSHSENGYVEFSIQDNGPGLPKEIEENLFEPFHTTKSASEGTGLGLSLVRRFVDAHKGDILHERSPTGGARFIVRLRSS